jgi:hypothetical protein
MRELHEIPHFENSTSQRLRGLVNRSVKQLGIGIPLRSKPYHTPGGIVGELLRGVLALCYWTYSAQSQAERLCVGTI